MQAELQAIHALYVEDEWVWVLKTMPKYFGFEPENLSVSDLQSLLEKWKTSTSKLLNMVEMDATKEFEGNVRIGFGVDGNQDEDFNAVRGTFESNAFKLQLDEMRQQVVKDFTSSNELLNTL